MYFDAEDELEPDSPHSEVGNQAVLAWQTSLWRHSTPQSRKNTEEWVGPPPLPHTHLRKQVSAQQSIDDIPLFYRHKGRSTETRGTTEPFSAAQKTAQSCST